MQRNLNYQNLTSRIPLEVYDLGYTPLLGESKGNCFRRQEKKSKMLSGNK